jgi:PAS domain S-box-containing protein
MLRKLPFLFLVTVMVLFFIVAAPAQSTNVDSLETVLKKHTADDTIKVNLLNKIAQAIHTKDSEKTERYARQAIEIADRIGFMPGKIEALGVIGRTLSYNKSDKVALVYFLQALTIAEENNLNSKIAKYQIECGLRHFAMGNNAEAKELYQKAIAIAEENGYTSLQTSGLTNLSIIYNNEGNAAKALEGYSKVVEICELNGNKNILSRALGNIGAIYGTQGNHPKAIEYYHRCLKICEENNDKIGALNGTLGIGISNLHRSDYQAALDYLEKALKLAEELNDKRRISHCLTSIGDIYFRTNDSKALEYYQKALVISEEMADLRSWVTGLLYIGNYHKQERELGKALEYYQKALKLASDNKMKKRIGDASISIGSVQLINKEYSKALTNTKKGLEIANDMKLLTVQKTAHYQLSEIYSATKNYAMAYSNHKRFKELSDSIDKEENVKKIIELEYTYKFDKEKQAMELEQQKKDAVQLAQTKQQRMAIVSLLAGFIIISLFAAYVYRSYKAKHRTNIILAKQKAEIEELNEEYLALNEELMQSNEQLYHAKEVIEERENLLTQITDNVPVFISLVNSDLRYEFANKGYAKTFNRKSKDDLQGKTVKEILAADTYERAIPNLIKTLDGETVTFENTLQGRDERLQILQTTYTPYYFHEGIQGVLVCSSDITERKKNEQALREMEEEKKRLMEREMERINSELETNQKSMTAATLKLIQNSERDTQTIEQLEEIEKNTNPAGKTAINNLISNYKRASYNSNWEEFEILFEKVHSSFYENLSARYPDLTANERKMCAFLKLNMSNKDIAQITFQSDDALKKARLRLRQKLGIDRETNLVAFMQSL